MNDITYGAILVIVAFFIWLWNRMNGGTPEFSWTGPGTPTYGGGTSDPDTTEIDNPPVSLDYSLENAPEQVRPWYSLAKRKADKYGLPWQIILAQIWQESWGDPEAIGAHSDYGLMQVTPIAYQDLIDNRYNPPADWKFNPENNVECGTAFLHLMYQQTGVLADALGKTKADSLEAYNEGKGGASRDIGPDYDYSVPVIEKARKLGWNG